MTDRSAFASPRGMTILAQVMPVFRMRQVDHVAVEAPPQEAWSALEAFDASSISFVRWLFDLRLVPARIEARLRGSPVPPRARLGLRDVGAPGTGFHRLGEREGRELCVGAIDAPRSLVVGTPSLLKGSVDVEGWPPWRDTWAFVLEPIGDDACRLITRVRAQYVPGVKLAFITTFMAGAHALMGRVQLRNIKRRAEQGTPARGASLG